MDTPFAAELTEHSRALRALARVLVGEQHADDLVQEVALQALQGAPPMATGLRGWLQVVLRRQASNLRRGERRRRNRETAATAGARTNAPTTVVIAEQQELARRVTELLLDLPDPYRDTLFRRFFHDATPAAIAASTNVPIATVKSRLQRGLAMLRERLDAGSRPDWRPALSAAFGLEQARWTAPATATGGLFAMGFGIKVWFLAATAGVLGLLFLRSATAEPRQAIAPVDSGIVAGGAASPGSAGEPDQQPVARTAVATDAATSLTTATVRGRCVDERGQPLAGVNLHWQTFAWEGRIDEWTRRHDVPPLPSTDRTSGLDGTFEFVFAPLPPLRFELSLRTADRVPMAASFTDVEPGTIKDLGSVVMPRGTRLLGRLVDSTGAPQPSVLLVFETEGQEGDVTPTRGTRALTRSDGSFEATESLPAGDYTLHVPERRGITPERVAIDGQQPVVHADLVVDRVTAPMAIAGIVRDELGQPVAGANVQTLHGRHRERTDAEGRFRLAREPGSEDTVPLRVLGDGYEPLDVPVAWGRMDLELTLRPGIPFEFRVTEAPSGAPVEAYQVRGWRVENGRATGGTMLVHGRHPGGRSHVDRLPRGSYLLLVEPRAEELSPSTVLRLLVDDATAPFAALQVTRKVEQQVRVQFPDGSPVARSRVELVEPVGTNHEATWDVQDLDDSSWNASMTALRRDAATTDDAGLAVLRGPASARLGLRVSGPSHLATPVPALALTGAAPFVVTVRPGAAVTGRVAPASIVHDYASVGGFRPGRSWQDHAPSLGLRSGNDRRTAPIAQDGSFELQGVPPGSWEVGLEVDATIDHRHFTTAWTFLTRIDVAEEQQVKLDLDIAHLALARIHALVLHNGAPLADADLLLVRVTPDANGESQQVYLNARTDRDGRFVHPVSAGRYHLEYFESARTLSPLYPASDVMVSAPERVSVAPGQRVDMTYTLQTGAVRLRLSDADGAPVRGVRPMFWDNAAEDHFVQNQGTDENGVVVTALPVGTFDVRIPANGDNRRTIGEVSVAAGQVTEVELRLPPERER